MRSVLSAVLVSLFSSGTAFANSDGNQVTHSMLQPCGGQPCPVSDTLEAEVSLAPPPLHIAEIDVMPAGSWLHYGRPWRDIDPGRKDNCGRDFGTVLGAWNGVLWDRRYVWSWAAGGHGDGCFNGIIRYDLQTGTPEMMVPHLPLNVPFARGPFVKANGQVNSYYEPYVSETPWPGGMGRTDHTSEPILPVGDLQPVAELYGEFLRPRSSHIFNNIVKIGDWAYLLTGSIFGSSKGDNQVWRFNTTAGNIASTIERLPDRFDPATGPDRDGDGQPDGRQFGSYAVNWIKRPNHPPLMFSDSTVCQPNLVAGQYNCRFQQSIHFTASTTMAWDEGRQGIWAIDAKLNRLTFMREIDGQWVFDEELSVTDAVAINKASVGSGGLCLVPTVTGANPVIWGHGESLIRWDGKHLRTIDLPGGPRMANRRVFNKWTWNEDLGVCLGTWTVDEGFWVYKPEFASGSLSSPAPASQPEPISTADPGSFPDPDIPLELTPTPKPSLPPAPASRPGRGLPAAPVFKGSAGHSPVSPLNSTLKPKPSPESEPVQDIDLTAQWGIDPAAYPTFAGHRIAPAPWQPAAWDQPIERLPDAPDYDALCPGAWAELHYRSDNDLAASAAQVRGIVRGGTPNVRVYLHPRLNTAGQIVAYSNSIKFDRVQCAEIVGVPLDGEKPQMTGGVGASGVGIIARGIIFKGNSVRWEGNRATNTYPAFAVLHDLEIYAFGHLMGDSRPKAPLTYVELRGNVIGNNTDWHVIYLERSIGQLVALSNVFYGSGRSKHTFKNLAHQSRIEGNVFSNVGIDGQALLHDRRGVEVVGLMPLDLYLCTETIFRNNTVIFRTSDSVRAFMAYRGRRAWGNCDKGKRLENGRWELWPPESAEYDDPQRWAEIAAAASAFDRGYAAAKAEPWLFTHRVEDNHFIVFNAFKRGGKAVDNTKAARIVSLRPVADNPIRKALLTEARELAAGCRKAEDRKACVLAGMGPALRYAYDHLPPESQDAIVSNGKLPRGVPIEAPEGWVERSGVFWGTNNFITCSADGSDCRKTEPREVVAEPRAWDPVTVTSPPRVIMD